MKYIECLFIREDLRHPEPSPLIGVEYLDPRSAIDRVARRLSQGINHFLLFSVPRGKSIEAGTDPESGTARVLRGLKQAHGDGVTLFADVGLSPYRDDGHSVVLDAKGIDLEQSYADAARLAVAFGQAGTDYVAPCLSLPDQVAKLRTALDAAGLHTGIMSYSAKFSSALYGPYRIAIGSRLGDARKSYQTDFLDPDRALEQARRDEAQGASILMVKPGSLYLDILLRVTQATRLPVAVFQVSGEHMMIKRAAESGVLSEADIFDEIHGAFSRCGASYVIGYAAEHFLRWAR